MEIPLMNFSGNIWVLLPWAECQDPERRSDERGEKLIKILRLFAERCLGALRERGWKGKPGWIHHWATRKEIKMNRAALQRWLWAWLTKPQCDLKRCPCGVKAAGNMLKPYTQSSRRRGLFRLKYGYSSPFCYLAQLLCWLVTQEERGFQRFNLIMPIWKR